MEKTYGIIPIQWSEPNRYRTVEGKLAGCKRNTFSVSCSSYSTRERDMVYYVFSDLPGDSGERHYVDSIEDGKRKADDLLKTFLDNILI